MPAKSSRAKEASPNAARSGATAGDSQIVTNSDLTVPVPTAPMTRASYRRLRSSNANSVDEPSQHADRPASTQAATPSTAAASQAEEPPEPPDAAAGCAPGPSPGPSNSPKPASPPKPCHPPAAAHPWKGPALLAAAVLLPVLLAALMLWLLLSTWQPAPQCNPHLAGKVATTLQQLLPPHWRQQLLQLQDDLSCDTPRPDEGAKALAAAILCSGPLKCTALLEELQGRLSTEGGSCLWLRHFQREDTETGWLQKQLVEFSLRCPRGGVVVMHGALGSAAGNLHTLIAVLSEVGHLRDHGRAVHLQQHAFLLLEELPGSGGGQLLGSAQQQELQLRRLLKGHLYERHGVVPRSNPAAVVDAAMRRLDYLFASN